MICSACSAQLPHGARFCLQCGNSLVPHTSTQASQSWFCPRCGQSNIMAAQACAACNTPHPYQLPNYPPIIIQPAMAPKNRGVYIILGILFGGLGVHNFYAGRGGVGAAQLLIMIFTFWLILPILFVWGWVILELFIVDTDGYGNKMR
jgi:TM2 domain-containing membrane protein YozV